MGNVIVFVILAFIVFFAVRYSITHFSGSGDCCGGGCDSIFKEEIPKKVLSGTKIGEKHVSIKGMKCDNCVLSVTKAINKIDGASADVDLKKNEATVSYDREISDNDIKTAIENAGYEVTAIS